MEKFKLIGDKPQGYRLVDENDETIPGVVSVKLDPITINTIYPKATVEIILQEIDIVVEADFVDG